MGWGVGGDDAQGARGQQGGAVASDPIREGRVAFEGIEVGLALEPAHVDTVEPGVGDLERMAVPGVVRGESMVQLVAPQMSAGGRARGDLRGELLAPAALERVDREPRCPADEFEDLDAHGLTPVGLDGTKPDTDSGRSPGFSNRETNGWSGRARFV